MKSLTWFTIWLLKFIENWGVTNNLWKWVKQRSFLLKILKSRSLRCDFFWLLNWMEKKFTENSEDMLNYTMPCSCSLNLSSFWLVRNKAAIAISSNGHHLEGTGENVIGHNFERGPSNNNPNQICLKVVKVYNVHRLW
jgi:hypothetical protein